MSALTFTEPRDVSTGVLDHTPRLALTVNGHVTVEVATAQPADGWIAGCYIAPTLTVPSASQLQTLAAIGVRDTHGQSRVDVPGHLWRRFYQRLRAAGAPLPDPPTGSE
ncbi:hypothetical protein [Microbacterium sp. 4NA327F11]|uniref:hypothetical protein n=1 Tax=Microbacterium sp. 4NA327F11 TaxID=2502229 RepID=UPI0010F9C70D|nr:hypothetical protein [Microbacterium sp. 4NA327F11]